MPNLKEVVVPSAAIGYDGELFDSVEWSKELEVWANRREELEREPIFKTGQVKLRKVDVGLKGEWLV